MHGTGSGTQLFIDILDNRNPGSTTDDAERWTVSFLDDFVGWQQLEFPFASFTRKEIGNGAPNDGLGLFEMHGWALGTLGTGGPRTYYVDEVSRYGVAEPPALAVQFSIQNTFIDEGTTGDVAVKLNRPMGPDDPAQVSIDYATEPGNAVPGEDYTPTSGTLTFTNGGPNELTFPVETFDNTKFSGDKRVVIRLSNPVDVERGALFQGSVLIRDDELFDPKLLDDFEQGAFLWETDGPVEIDAVRCRNGRPRRRPGQDAVENVLVASVPLHADIEVQGTGVQQRQRRHPGAPAEHARLRRHSGRPHDGDVWSRDGDPCRQEDRRCKAPRRGRERRRPGRPGLPLPVQRDRLPVRPRRHAVQRRHLRRPADHGRRIRCRLRP